MTSPITILIADDHGIVRDGVRAYLQTQSDLEIVAEAADGAEAVQMVIEHVPDVVLLDLVMPHMDGIEAIRQIRLASPRTQIVVLTSFHDDTHIFPALKAGALSYLLKDINPKGLATAVRQAAHGETTLHPHIATRLVNDVRTGQEQHLDMFAQLSHREREVLRLIAEGMSNAEIAQKLILSEKTIKSYVSNVLNKLHLADRTQAAVLAWREGLVQREE